MEKSDHYYRRKLCIQQSLAPTITQVKNELGNDLAEMIFATCPNAVQPVLGLAPPLKGPSDDLWMSPSDTLAGMVCLKPPLTGKYMKALTHQGILLIGQDIEKKFWNEARLEKEKDLKDQAEVLTFMGELQKRKAVEEALEMHHKNLIDEKDTLSIAFASQLENELNRLQLTLNAEYQRTFRNRERKLNEEWQDKLEQAVADSVKELSKNFIKQLELEGNSMYEKFQLDIKKEKVKHQFELQEARKGCQESFTQLKHQLECKNIANIMYILCAERQKCRTERMIIEDNYQAEIEHLQSVISNKEESYAELLMKEEKKTIQLDQRDEYLKEILRQFQKFINFALRSSPTQAEFLLDVEKLVTFELTTEGGSLKPKEKCDDVPSTVITWKSDGENIETSEENVTISDSQKEVTPHLNEQLVKSSDLPTLHYNKHVYIREGFHDMVTSDMKISPDDFIYSSGEVEVSVAVKVEDETIPIKDTAQLEKEEILQRTSILFGEHQTHESEDLISPVYENIPTKLLDEATTQLEELSRATIYKESPLFEDVQKTCCSRCTQTYINNYNPPIQKAMYNSTHDSSRVRLITSRDSLVKYRGTVKHDHKEEDDEKVEMSRLSLARDSFIINKHSIASKRASSQTNLEDEEFFSDESQTNQTASDLKPFDRSKMSPIPSKLSFSKDSLVLLRSQSMISRSRFESKDSVEISNENRTRLSENESRAVKVSHFEVLTLYDKPKKGDTGFDKNLTAIDSPWLTYGYKTKEKASKKKTESTVKIVGDTQLEVHTQKQDDFILDRAKSMMSIFKKHPSLVKLFTACTY